MIVLGFDTATSATAVGLRLADGTTLRAYDEPEADRSRETLASGEHPRFGQRPGHTTQSLTLASRAAEAGGHRLGCSGADRGGRGAGHFHRLARRGRHGARPGAVTGDRGRGRQQLGVLAQAALREPGSPARAVLAAIDARRGEAFAAAYDAQGELTHPRALPPEELAAIPGGARAGIANGWP